MSGIMRKSLLPSLVVLLVALPLCATKQPEPKPQTMSGEAIVRTIGPDRIAVLIDTNDDKAIDQGFLLSSDIPVSSTSAHCPAANVEFTDGYVRLVYDTKVYDLYVAGYPEPPAVKEKATTKFVGYALQHSSGSSGCNLERALSDAGACFGYGK
jgi:hypothetical protein